MFPSATARSLLPGNVNFSFVDGDGDIELLRNPDVLNVLLVCVEMALLNRWCVCISYTHAHVHCCDGLTEILRV